MEIHHHPIVVIKPEHQAIIDALVQEAVDKGYGECSFLGFGERTANGAIVHELVSPKQENSSGSSDMDEEHVHQLQLEMFDKGYLLVWWGHSHGNMNSFFSGTDWSTFEMLTATKPDNFFASVYSTKSERHDVVYTPHLLIEGEAFAVESYQEDPDISEHTANWSKPKVSAYVPKIATPTPMYATPKTTALAQASGWNIGLCPECQEEIYLNDDEISKPLSDCYECRQQFPTHLGAFEQEDAAYLVQDYTKDYS